VVFEGVDEDSSSGLSMRSTRIPKVVFHESTRVPNSAPRNALCEGVDEDSLFSTPGRRVTLERSEGVDEEIIIKPHQ